VNSRSGELEVRYPPRAIEPRHRDQRTVHRVARKVIRDAGSPERQPTEPRSGRARFSRTEPPEPIGARRHRGVPGIPGRGPRGRVQLPPQLRDQSGQRLDLPRLLADQRITRILWRQRLGQATRSFPKPAQPAAAAHSSQATVTSTSLTQRHPKLKQTGGRECITGLRPNPTRHAREGGRLRAACW
jgi:hypothetical protein